MRELFERTVNQILMDHVTTAQILAAETSGWSQSLWEVFEENGVTLALVPEAMGGTEAQWADVCGMIIACGKHCLPLPVAETLFANWLLSEVGVQPPEGSVVFTAESSLALMAGKVSGELIDVPWGRSAGHIIALTDADIPTLILLSTADGQVIKETKNIASEPRDTIRFDDVTPVAMAELPVHYGHDILRLGGALIRSAQITGAVHRVLEMARDYANERVQFGKPIGKFQAVQHQIAQLAEQASLAMSSTETAFSLSINGLDASSIVVAKICTAEAASAAANYAHGVHGAIGFTHEYPLHVATRRLWSWRSEFGSLTYWSAFLGDQVCQRSSDSYWSSLVSGNVVDADCTKRSSSR